MTHTNIGYFTTDISKRYQKIISFSAFDCTGNEINDDITFVGFVKLANISPPPTTENNIYYPCRCVKHHFFTTRLCIIVQY